MKALLSIALAVCVLAGVGARGASAANQPGKPMPAVTPEFIEDGKLIYFRRCSFCHGLLGDGNGPAADFLDPGPGTSPWEPSSSAAPRAASCPWIRICSAP